MEISDIIQDLFQGVTTLFTGHHRELINTLRVPTPVKVSNVQIADASGVIGGGLSGGGGVPQSHIYRCPMSHEAWLHRITITSPGASPKAPLTTGQVMLVGQTSGEVIAFLPISGAIAPVQIVEGRLSAPHLNAGETVIVLADSLPANTALRFDLQIGLVTGISEYTPRLYNPDSSNGAIRVYD